VGKPRDGNEGSARQRLLSAAMEVLVERGYRGATAREIAGCARVTEVTLFRLFSTKDDLIVAALQAHAEADRQGPINSTGNLEQDLEALAQTAMAALMGDSAQMIRVLPEVKRLPAAHQEIVLRDINEGHARVMALLEPYMQSGELDPDLRDDLWSVLFGPLLQRALDAQVGIIRGQFDAHRYVQAFLKGAAGPAYRRRSGRQRRRNQATDLA
jgi:AcrR family transcriptional regulator